MEVEAAKLIGAGLATIALAGAGIGIGNIFASYVSAAIRNPSAAPKVFGNVFHSLMIALCSLRQPYHSLIQGDPCRGPL